MQLLRVCNRKEMYNDIPFFSFLLLLGLGKSSEKDSLFDAMQRQGRAGQGRAAKPELGPVSRGGGKSINLDRRTQPQVTRVQAQHRHCTKTDLPRAMLPLPPLL